MLVNSDYRALYFQYLKSSGYSASSVRIIRSDVNHFTSFLDSNGLYCNYQDVIPYYRNYLTRTLTPFFTLGRRLSNSRRFMQWLEAEGHLILSKSYVPPLDSSSNSTTALPRQVAHYDDLIKPMVRLIVFVLVPIMLFSAIYIFTHLRSSRTEKNFASVIADFQLSFSSPDRYIGGDFDSITYKIYDQSIENSFIGYYSCPAGHLDIPQGLSTIHTKISSDCDEYPAGLSKILATHEALSVEIWLNNRIISRSLIHLSPIDLTKSSSANNKDINGMSEQISKQTDLSLIQYPSDVLGASQKEDLLELRKSIPLSIFRTSFKLSEGDVVALVDGQLGRALLSSEILGVISGESIVTQGVVASRIDNSSKFIHTGDFLTLGVTPGRVKTIENQYETTLGIALEDLKPDSELIKVLIFQPSSSISQTIGR